MITQLCTRAKGTLRSTNEKETVYIKYENGNDDITVEYKGRLYRATFNPLNGLLYVDDLIELRKKEV